MTGRRGYGAGTEPVVIPKGKKRRKFEEQLHSPRRADGAQRRKVVWKVKRVRIRLHGCVCVWKPAL